MSNSFVSIFSRIENKIKNIIKKFSLTEKLIFSVLFMLLIFSLLSSLFKINSTYLVEVPQKGGVIKEGLIGTPRFINPVIAISETDRDISSLVYSGLLKNNSKGEIANDLASEFTISEDGLTYYVKIRDDAFFHDGTPVTTDDVIFTIQKTQDPTIKSPKRPNWDGVLIEKINEKEIEFILSNPFSPFQYNLTLGVLPKHIWENISSDEFAFSNFNLEPIGSGPYMIADVNKDRNGIVKSYELSAYEEYTQGEPFIKKIQFDFFRNEDDLIESLNKNKINSAHSVSPNKISEINTKNKEINTSPFSRVFALYFNQAESDILSNKTIREVLNEYTPREEIIENMLAGFASPINSALPTSDSELTTINKEQAIEKLENNGWTRNENGIFEKETDSAILTFSFSISTANVQELVEVTEILAERYREIGADINVKIFEPNDLTLNVIRPREFESIFFGQVINRDMDIYAFWHSSQRNDPGLNIAGFTNIDADSALEKVRTAFSQEERLESLQIFEKEVINDVPAIFLYSPDFIYISPKELNLEVPKTVVTSSDRFADIEKWYIETDSVWKIFSD
jgi:peptide/nickel transport system substrate-binding protein